MGKQIKKEVRLELRASDVDIKLHSAVVDSAKKNLRTVSKELIFQLNKVYKLDGKN